MAKLNTEGLVKHDLSDSLNDSCYRKEFGTTYVLQVWAELHGESLEESERFTIRLRDYDPDNSRYHYGPETSFKKAMRKTDMVVPWAQYKPYGRNEAEWGEVPAADLNLIMIALQRIVERETAIKQTTTSSSGSSSGSSGFHCPDCHGTGTVDMLLYKRDCVKQECLIARGKV